MNSFLNVFAANSLNMEYTFKLHIYNTIQKFGVIKTF